MMRDEDEEPFVVDLTNSHLHSLEQVVIPNCTKVRVDAGINTTVDI